MKNLIYKFLELLYKNGVQTEISGVSLRLPFRYYRYYKKNYEADNISFFKKAIKKNDVILDIGAQIGLMTKLFSDLCGAGGKVYAFEPTPFTYSILQKTIALNKIEKTAVAIKAAVSDKKGKAMFNISEVELDASNSLSHAKRKHATTGVEVDIISIDDFVKENHLSKIDFIKIDAEGAEYFVLLGALETLAKHKPIVNLALHPLMLADFGPSLEEIYDFIFSENYEVLFESKPMSKEQFLARSYDLFDVQLFPKN